MSNPFTLSFGISCCNIKNDLSKEEIRLFLFFCIYDRIILSLSDFLQEK